MQTDTQIVRATLKGGSHHFGLLVKRYADYLFGLGMRISLGNVALAEDASQQAFLKAFTYLKSFDQSKDFKHWLTGIAVNCCRDLLKDASRYCEFEATVHAFDTSKTESNDEFFKLIRPLNDEEKQLFVLRYVYEYSIDEIAQMLAVKPGTVKSKISRGVEKLR
jgi:RNA polymerase sigma-70 factor (ECF subfamily)